MVVFDAVVRDGGGETCILLLLLLLLVVVVLGTAGKGVLVLGAATGAQFLLVKHV
jgi:hypothetical protein